MRDVDLYRQVLGLEAPWTVTRVELSVTEERVDVWAGHAARVRWPCPTCGKELPVYDHAAERAWRHLDTCQFVTSLHARPPRVACPDHGVRQVRLPWAESHARFTLLFERLAIDVLKECDIRGATRILRISWDEAWHLLAPGGRPGPAREGAARAAAAGRRRKGGGQGTPVSDPRLRPDPRDRGVHRRRPEAGEPRCVFRHGAPRPVGQDRSHRHGQVGALRASCWLTCRTAR